MSLAAEASREGGAAPAAVPVQPAPETHVDAGASRREGHLRSPVQTNLEGDDEYTVRWAWADGFLEPGLTAVIRAKNEARSLPWVLPPLFRSVARVVFVDNDSTDGTAGIARDVAEESGARDRLEVFRYPFAVSRCGREHLLTPPTSVHSLAYFYNWSFSHVRSAYALKWDADMVLTDAASNVLRDLSWQLEGTAAIVSVPRVPLYVADERRAFLDMVQVNCEVWGWPNRPGYSFVKGMEWELPLFPDRMTNLILPMWSCFELKFLDADEFGHWSESSFASSARTERKHREWSVFQALAAGAEVPDGVLAIEAPPGSPHVIEYVRTTWMPEKAVEQPAFGERLVKKLLLSAL